VWLGRPLSGVGITLGPRVMVWTLVFGLRGIKLPHLMVVMIMLEGPLCYTGIIPRPLRWLSELFSMNIPTTFRTFVGIIMFCQGWGMINILRSWKLGEWKNYIVFVGMK
jgi:hypothetical protein